MLVKDQKRQQKHTLSRYFKDFSIPCSPQIQGNEFLTSMKGHFSYHNLTRNFSQVQVTLVSRNTKQTSGLAKALHSEMYRKHACMTNHAIAPQRQLSVCWEKAVVEDSPQNIMHKPEISFILWKCYDNWYDTNAQSYLQVSPASAAISLHNKWELSR